jgi:hypothetical protein
MKCPDIHIEELKQIQKDIAEKGFSVKEYHSSVYGFDQNYKLKIYTKSRTIDNIYIN